MVHTQIKYIMICDAQVFCTEHGISKNAIIQFSGFYDVTIYEIRDVTEFIFFQNRCEHLQNK